MIRVYRKLSFILFLGSITPLIAQDSLRIMTYNLEGMKPGSDPQTRILYAIQALKKLNPDVIGLQEINESLNTSGADNQAKVIADSLSAYFGIPYYRYIGFTHLSWYDQFNEYIGIITKYPVIESGYFQLIKGAFPRKVLWNQINTPLGKINFFTTHLDHKTADIRVQQVQQIISYIADRDTVSPASASILTGDFNDGASTPTILLLTNPSGNIFFKDSFREVNPLIQGNTIPSSAPSSRIDFIFYKNTGELNISSSTVVMANPYTGIEYPSDHLGVMTIFTKTITGVHHGENLNTPDNFELYQNYPNPFNPTTTIKYQIPQTGSVRLIVYDMLGREIVTLVNERLSAGSYSTVWNASGFASGVYFYKLTNKKYTTIKHMVLMK